MGRKEHFPIYAQKGKSLKQGCAFLLQPKKGGKNTKKNCGKKKGANRGLREKRTSKSVRERKATKSRGGELRELGQDRQRKHNLCQGEEADSTLMVLEKTLQGG